MPWTGTSTYLVSFAVLLRLAYLYLGKNSTPLLDRELLYWQESLMFSLNMTSCHQNKKKDVSFNRYENRHQKSEKSKPFILDEQLLQN